jgi:hypothetical protein
VSSKEEEDEKLLRLAVDEQDFPAVDRRKVFSIESSEDIKVVVVGAVTFVVIFWSKHFSVLNVYERVIDFECFRK